MIIIPEIHEQDEDRTEIFREHAQARARGAGVASPTLYDKGRRRLYLRQTMRADRQCRIRNRPEGAPAKFDKLASSLFSVIPNVFVANGVCFAATAVKRVYKDYKLFPKELDLGALKFLHGV